MTSQDQNKLLANHYLVLRDYKDTAKIPNYKSLSRPIKGLEEARAWLNFQRNLKENKGKHLFLVQLTSKGFDY